MLHVDGFVIRTFVSRGTVLSLVVLLSMTGCHAVDKLFCNGAGCEWTKEEWTRVQSLAAFCDTTDTDPNRRCDDGATVSDRIYALTPPIDRSNAVAAIDNSLNADAVNLGWKMYFDTRFSGNATLVDSIGRAVPYARAATGQPTGLACATCHDPRRAGGDFTSSPNTVSIGAGWYDVNGEQTMNVAFYDLLYWNGRSDSLWSQAAAVSESGVSMNGDRLNTFWMIVTYYADQYNRIFPDTPLPTTMKRSEVAAMLVTAADQTADPTLVVGECKRASGMCPTGCFENSGACWPIFPLHGKPGRRAGCETRTPGKPAEPSGDAYDCVAAEPVAVGSSDTVGNAVTQVLVNFGKAIAAYETKLVSLESPFDRFVHEGPDSTAISPAAKRGARLFVGKASCIDCHNGPMLTDKVFHNISVPQVGDHIPTLADCWEGNASCDCTTVGKDDTCLPSGAWGGLWKLTLPSNKLRRTSKWGDTVGSNGEKDESLSAWYCAPVDQSLKGSWRTPSLRDVATTAPYMHDGYYRTLEDVLWHYNNGGTAAGTDLFQNSGGTPAAEADGGCAPPDPGQQTPLGHAAQIKPLRLTEEEIADVVAFLKTLSGQPFHPDMLSNPPPDMPAPMVDAGTDAGSDAGTGAGTDAGTAGTD